MKIITTLAVSVCLLLSACSHKQSSTIRNMKEIHPKIVKETMNALKEKYPDLVVERTQKGVEQMAALWTEEDGTADAFKTFCLENYVYNETERQQLFESLSAKLELLKGHFNLLDLKLKASMQEVSAHEPNRIDMDFSGFDVGAHFKDDMFQSKIAFFTVLNFPAYSLAEKEVQGKNWSRLQWAYARMGDVFSDRIPANIQQQLSSTLNQAENYVANYNIMMGEIRNESGNTLFPKDMVLISHWGLRDELKSHYAGDSAAKEKQDVIYAIMKRIVKQEIPQCVINKNDVQWCPVNNKVYQQGKEIEAAAENNKRYEILLNDFKAMQAVDHYVPSQPTYLQRAYEGTMEISKEEIRKMFVTLLSSEEVKMVAGLIKQRMGVEQLRPYDIWYDGFKFRSNISEASLTEKTQKKYPTAEALQKDLPEILRRLGFKDVDARNLADKIEVDAARGSGHAWAAEMKGDKAHLRTRILPAGMDYKGYNIAIHEFGHNVEQTISLYDVDYYMMKGVPDPAFTEALAFIFQKRDLAILGVDEKNPEKEHLNTLDVFWHCYENMGVSLVDMETWEWMYAHPEATPQELKENVLRISGDIWNKYYAPLLGDTDSPILSIYSHMLNSPLYLVSYPFGHLVEFQLEEYLKGKNFADEIFRIYTLGRLTPQAWMQAAVGSKVSVDPLLKATRTALEQLKKNSQYINK